MKLKDLLTVDALSDARFDTIEVGGISADSRTVKRGDLFVAIAGSKDDGLRFVAPAVAAGAAAVMAERVAQAPLPSHVAFVRVSDARRALALAASRFYPWQPQTIAAVTGTSGKTSVAAFTRQIWAATGDISQNVASATRGTKQIVTVLTDVVSAATETRQSAETVLTASEAVAAAAGDLRAEVETFLHKVAV